MKMYTAKSTLEEKDREKLNKYSDIVAHLLYHRGVKSNDVAEEFLSPDYDKGICDPYLINDMEKAVKRIIEAISNNQKIAIYSDYDADGIPGAVIAHDLLKRIGYDNFVNYIPDRSEEGFGLNKYAIDKLSKAGVKLIVTIDCGTAEVENIKYANSLGIEVIITDHHLPGSVLPDAFAIVNPKISPNYPDKMICGAGVVFKLIQAILLKNNFGMKQGEEKWFLDMVGIATLSDMVPLKNENRVFASYGLIVLRKTRRVGLRRLFAKLKIDQRRISEDDIGFMIAPRINAASRMGISYDAFRLLTTDDVDEADSLINKLEKANKERKGTTAFLVKEVKKHINAKYSSYVQNKVIVAGDPTWKPSLLGLVANTLAEEENKPVFLWGRDGAQDNLKGSCRSVGQVSVTELMNLVSPGIFTEYGGHSEAGGFAVSYESVHSLEEELEKAYSKVSTNFSNEKDMVDSIISIENISKGFIEEIEQLSPFGIGNEKPLFLISEANVYNSVLFGKEKNHLKISLAKEDGELLEAVSFFVSEKILDMTNGKSRLSIVGNIEKSFFLGKETIRIRIADVL